MAFKTSQSGEDMAENHEINVTPFVDVMLVLLIIVMVAAPLATVNVPVDLPTSSASPTPMKDDPVYLTIQKDLTIVIDESNTVDLANLTTALKTSLPDNEQRIYLRADKALVYQDLLKVMNKLAAAGYTQIALVGLEQPKRDDP